MRRPRTVRPTTSEGATMAMRRGRSGPPEEGEDALASLMEAEEDGRGWTAKLRPSADEKEDFSEVGARMGDTAEQDWRGALLRVATVPLWESPNELRTLLRTPTPVWNSPNELRRRLGSEDPPPRWCSRLILLPISHGGGTCCC